MSKLQITVLIVFLMSLLNPKELAFVFAKTTNNQTLIKNISAEFIWEGEFSGTYSFNGKAGDLLKTQILKSNQNCEIDVRPLFVSYKKQPHLKLNLFVACLDQGKTLKITLEPIYVNLKDLSVDHQNYFISDKYKKNHFKISQLQY